MNPDDVLRKGSGTLCETLLMVILVVSDANNRSKRTNEELYYQINMSILPRNITMGIYWKVRLMLEGTLRHWKQEFFEVISR